MSRLPVVVLSGLHRLAVDDLATGLLLRHERLAVITADPTTADADYITLRVYDSTGAAATRRVPLEHRCVSCTLIAGLAAELATIAGAGRHERAIVQLHPGIEVDALLRGLSRRLSPANRLDGHVTVLSTDWFDVLSSGDGLAEHDAALGPDDDRFAANLLASGIEQATTIVVADDRRRDPEQLVDDRAVLDLLAPDAVRLRLRNVLDVPDEDVLAAGRFDPVRLDPLSAYGLRDPAQPLSADSSLSLVRWTARRPLHPLRLQESLDRLADGVVRSSGRLDVADQPDAVVGWDSAGESLLLGPIMPNRTPPARRRSTLAFLGDGLDAAHIGATLDACLLNAAEMTLLTSMWSTLHDVLPAEQHGHEVHESDIEHRGDDAA